MKKLFFLMSVLSLGLTGCNKSGYVPYWDVNDPELFYNMLVVGANDEEVNIFIDKVHRDGYRYSQESYEHYDRFVSKTDGKSIYVVRIDNIDQIPTLKFGIIQLKSHTNDIGPLLDALESRSEFIEPSKTVLLIGGCESYQYTEWAQEFDVIPIVVKYIGQNAHNDYLSLQLHSHLANMSLMDALQKIRREAPGTYNQYYMPALRKSLFQQLFSR